MAGKSCSKAGSKGSGPHGKAHPLMKKLRKDIDDAVASVNRKPARGPAPRGKRTSVFS